MSGASFQFLPFPLRVYSCSGDAKLIGKEKIKEERNEKRTKKEQKSTQPCSGNGTQHAMVRRDGAEYPLPIRIPLLGFRSSNPVHVPERMWLVSRRRVIIIIIIPTMMMSSFHFTTYIAIATYGWRTPRLLHKT